MPGGRTTLWSKLYIHGLLRGIEYKQTAYALDCALRKAALERILAEYEVPHELAA